MPAASRQSDCRPSAPTTRRADSDLPCRVRMATRNVVGVDRVRVIVEPRQVRKLGGALLQRRSSARGFRCCSRTRRGRFHRDENRTSGARIRRPVSSTRRIACKRRGLVDAARPDVQSLAANRPSRPTARWCDYRHRARGARSGPCSRRPAPARSPPQVRQGRRRSRRHRSMADASFISGQLTFPAAFSSPPHRLIVPPICATERRKCRCANRSDS